MAVVSRNLIEILIAARDEASAVLKKAGGNVASVEKQIAVASSAMAAAGAAFLATATAAAVAGGRYAQSLEALSKRTLVSKETLAALGVQLVKGGGQFEDAEQAVRQFSQAVINALSGQREAVLQFERLGISVDDLVGPGGKIKSFEELLPRVARGFQNLNDKTLQLDTVTALYGRSATKMVPLLAQGEAGLARMAEEARDTSAILSGPAQASAARFGDRLDDLKLSVVGLNNALAAALDPTLGSTVTALADAAKAAAQFAQAHPVLIQNVTATVAAIAGAAGLVTALTLARSAFLKLMATLNTSGALRALGGAFTDAGGRIQVAGRGFVTTRAAILANTVALAKFSAIAAVAGGVIATLIAENSKMRREQESFGKATRDAENALRDETKSALDLIVALNQLRAAKKKDAENKEPERPPLGLQGEARINFAQAAQIRAGEAAERQFDEETADLRRALEAKAAAETLGIELNIEIDPKLRVKDISIPPLVDLNAPSFRDANRKLSAAYRDLFAKAVPRDIPSIERAKLTIHAPEIDVEKLNSRELEDQIALQEKAVDEARARMVKLGEKINKLAQEGAPETTISLIRPQFDEASKDFQSASDRLDSLRDRSKRLREELVKAAEDMRNVGDSARDAELQLVALDVAAGKITLDEALRKSVTAMDLAEKELVTAREAVAAAIPDTKAYASAVDQQTEAMQNYEAALSSVTGFQTEINDRHRDGREGALAMADALKQLKEAEEDLATVQGKGKVKNIQKQLDERNLARLSADRTRTRGLADQEAGPVPPERFAEAADAASAYADAMLQAQIAQEKLSASGAILSGLGGLIGDVFSGIASGALNMAQVVSRAILGMIADMIRLAIQALLVKKILGGLVTLGTGGAGAPIGGAFGIAGFGIPKQDGGELLSGIRGMDNTLVSIGRGEGIFSHDVMDDMKGFLAEQKRSGTEERSAQPPIQLKQNITIQAGTMLGTEIETQRFGREIADKGSVFARQFIASPSFTR